MEKDSRYTPTYDRPAVGMVVSNPRWLGSYTVLKVDEGTGNMYIRWSHSNDEHWDTLQEFLGDVRRDYGTTVVSKAHYLRKFKELFYGV